MDPVPRDAERPRPLRWDPLQWLAAAFAVVLIGVLAGALLGKLAWTWISPFTFLTFSANMASQANRHCGIPGKETEAKLFTATAVLCLLATLLSLALAL